MRKIEIKNRTGEAKYYDAKILAWHITDRYTLFRSSTVYKKTKDLVMDYTMACDRQEVLDWMNYYMGKAIEMETEAKLSRNSRTREEAAALFLVAYDIQDSLLSA